jgi:hypothetical protein
VCRGKWYLCCKFSIPLFRENHSNCCCISFHKYDFLGELLIIFHQFFIKLVLPLFVKKFFW